MAATTTAAPPALNITGSVRSLPLELCDIGAGFKRRFEYDIDSLAESIYRNGQIHPGVAVVRPGGRYEIIAGHRRLLGCKKSFELHGKPDGFLATVLDEGVSEKEQQILAMAENEHEKGQRQDLTIEEEIAYFGSLAQRFPEEEVVEIGTRAGKSAETVRRLLKLSEAMGRDGRLHDAYKIEQRTDFKFRLGHLEELSKIEEPKPFVQAAATTAHTRADPAEIGRDVVPAAGEVCESIPWFAAVFPELSDQGAPRSAGQGEGEEDEDEEEEEPEGEAASVIPRCVFVVCPHPGCGAGAPVEFRVKGEMSYDFLWGKKGLERVPIAPEMEQSGHPTCRWCGKSFFARIWRNSKDRKVMLRVSTTRETTGTAAAVAEPCTVKRGPREEWILVKGRTRYLYGRDGKLREDKGRGRGVGKSG